MTKTDSYANHCVNTEGKGNDSKTSSEYQCDDSDETFDKSLKPLSIAQKILNAEKGRDRSKLSTQAYVKSLDMLRWRRSQKVGSFKNIPPWYQTTATSSYTESKPSESGNSSIHSEQSVTTTGTNSQMEFQHRLLRQTEKMNKLNTMINKSNERSQKKSPPLQMHYSQSVPKLNGPFIPSMSELLNSINSTDGCSSVIDSPQPLNKEFSSVQMNGNSGGASRKGLFSYSLPTITQDKTCKTYQSYKELTAFLSDFSRATKSRPTPTERNSAIPDNESTVVVQNAENMKPNYHQMQPVESTTNSANGHIADRHTLPLQSLKGCYRSNIKNPALWDHSYIEATNETAEHSPVKLIHPATNIANESIEQTNTLPPDGPKEFDRASISIPTQSHVLNEMVTSSPAVSDCESNERNEAKNAATSQLSPERFVCSTSSIENESVWPPEFDKEPSNIGIPAVTRNYSLNEIGVPASASSDHSHPKATKTENAATLNLIHPTNAANESTEQANILPSQSPKEFDRSDINIPAATERVALNEILVSVPTPSDYSGNKPIDVENSATELSSATSVIPPRAAMLFNQQNIVQTPMAMKATTSVVNSSGKTRKRTYKRANKIFIQSDELIKMGPSPPVGSIISTLPNSTVRINSNQIIHQKNEPNPTATIATSQKRKNMDRINSNQIIGHQKPPNLHENAKPFQMANTKIQVKNEAKSKPPTTARSLKRKNTDNIPTNVPMKAQLQMKNEPKWISTATVATSQKRKNLEAQLHAPAKVQKIAKPTQETMINVKITSISVNLPEITIEPVNIDQKDTKTAAATSLENRSFTDCVKFLQRNNVAVFKVPRNPQPFKGAQNLQPSNVVLDKYLKVLQRNGVCIERVSKNINRAQ